MTIAYQAYEEAAGWIRQRLGENFDAAIVLGSGLGALTQELSEARELRYEEIPHFPVSTVDSHAGKLLAGVIGGKRVLLMSGRFHFYEGYSMEQAAFAVRVMKLLGISTLILTNAAGGINVGFAPGDLMLITDHIKFFSDSPARGPEIPQFGPRFFDMSEAYSKKLRAVAEKSAVQCGISLKQGVYAFMPGPQFETPAEIRMLRMLGADAVGMSTVPEVIAASQCGIRVLGISCISNLAAGMVGQPVTDEEVVEVTGQNSARFCHFMKTVITNL